MRIGTIWYIVAAISFAIGIISALGEWVFHWWKDPGDWLSVASFLVGLASLANGTSGTKMEKRCDDSDAGHRRLADGQDRLITGQDKLIDGQEKFLAGQEEQTRLLREMGQRQEEQTSLLRQVVESFRSFGR